MVLPQNPLTKGHSTAMNSITHSQRYLPHTIETRFYAESYTAAVVLYVLSAADIIYPKHFECDKLLMSSFLLIAYYLLCSGMRLVATLMLALEGFFLKLKLFILTGIAGGLIVLKLQS